jgi:hypothetical protein
LWAVLHPRKKEKKNPLHPSKNSRRPLRVFVLLLVIPAMRRADEAAVLYIWTRRLARRPSSFLESLFMKCTRSIGRLLLTKFIFSFSIFFLRSLPLSWQQIITLWRGVLIFTHEKGEKKLNTEKAGAISHATGPIWIVLLGRPMRSY